jgi:hypothetical protein
MQAKKPAIDARGQLPAVLDVQQHPRNQPRGAIRALLRAKRTDRRAGQVIDGGNAALVT